MVMLSVGISIEAVVTFSLVGVGIVIVPIYAWVLFLVGRIVAMPKNHAMAAWRLIMINLLEPIISTCWIVGLILFRTYSSQPDDNMLSIVLGQDSVFPSIFIEFTVYYLEFYWPMLGCLVGIPAVGLLNGNPMNRQTAKVSLICGVLRIMSVITVYPLLFTIPYLVPLAIGLSIYSYHKIYQHAKTILQAPMPAVTLHNQQLAIGSANPETAHIATTMNYNDRCSD